jgi:N-acetylmuramoyl-L-alanine amidase-like
MSLSILLFIIVSEVLSPPTPCGNTAIDLSNLILSNNKISIQLDKLSKKPLIDRIDYWSKQFMGTPYVIDPLGEGEGQDPDPRFNMCGVDCETYVEQVLSLSFSKTPLQIFKWLDLMRYRGGIRKFNNRYYTMILDWIPQNLKLGYLTSGNHHLGKHLPTITKKIDPDYRWEPVFRKRFKLMGKTAPRGKASAQYVPMAMLRDKFNKIKTPAVGLLVGAKQTRNPFLITHMGIILKNSKGHMIWRHASRTRGIRKVQERLLSSYLRSVDKFFNTKRRRFVVGMIIYTIKDPKLE